MKLSVVLSTHAARFAAAAFKGDFAASAARIADMGYGGSARRGRWVIAWGGEAWCDDEPGNGVVVGISGPGT